MNDDELKKTLAPATAESPDPIGGGTDFHHAKIKTTLLAAAGRAR